MKQKLEVLDDALRTSVPPAPAPQDMHGEIMRAVRVASRERPEPQSVTLQWAPIGALVALAVLAVWSTFVVPSQTQTMKPVIQSTTASSPTLKRGGEFASSMVGVAVSPVTTELSRVNADLAKTAQFLLASIP